MKHINELYILKASYCFRDKTGNQVIIDVDYFGNQTFKLRKSNALPLWLKKEAQDFVSDLLTRKGGVNLVDK